MQQNLEEDPTKKDPLDDKNNEEHGNQPVMGDLELKNEELEKTLQKLMKQNEKLSNEIKDLRGQIMTAMEKNKKKPGANKPETEDPELKQLKTKIDAQAKEILGFQREIASLQEKTDGKNTKEKIVDLENSLKFKEVELERLNSDKKTLEEIKKNHQNIIEAIKSEKEYAKKVSSYQEEIRKLKEEIREEQKKEADYEKDQRKQHEYLAVLEQRYRDACKKNGVSASLNFTRAEKQNEESQQKPLLIQEKSKEKALKAKTSQNKKEKDLKKVKTSNEKSIPALKEFEEDQLPTEVNEENYKILVSKYQELQAYRQNLYKKYKSSEDSYQIKVKELDLERKMLTNKLKEKETEANIAFSRLNEIKRLAKQGSLPAHLEVLDKSIVKLTDNPIAKKSILKVLMDTKKRKTKRDFAGESSNCDVSEIVVLDDGDAVLGEHLTTDFKILEICIYHDGKSKIYGFKAIYMCDGERIEGNDNIMKQVKEFPNTKTTVLKLEEPGDNLKFISGYYKDFIEYLRLESVKGQSIIVGALSGERAKEMKEFCIDIKPGDTATVLFGAIRFNTASNNVNDYLLSHFGVEIVNHISHQKWLNRKKGKEDIEESIVVEEEAATLQRRGLVLGKKFPLKKKY